MRRRRSNQSWMDQTSEFDTGNVTTGAIDPVQIPACLASAGVVICQEASSVLLGKGTRKAPFVTVQASQVQKLHFEQVARLGCGNGEGTTQIMNLTEIHIFYVVRRIVVMNLTACPIDTLDAHYLAFLNRRHWWDRRVPAIVQRNFLLPWKFFRIDADDFLHHFLLLAVFFFFLLLDVILSWISRENMRESTRENTRERVREREKERSNM
mmetsp:Transcript_37629/g.53068  ORF Transcript_37629/g.53068 Transcript_37629/m.53068 type:complete len:210 (+) Transcript_37629:4149-4778(+)